MLEPSSSALHGTHWRTNVSGMCGRFHAKDPEEVRELGRRTFGCDLLLEQPRYNVAPSQTMPVVAAGKDGAPRIAAMRWGLVPYWDRNEKPKIAPINARSEDALTKSMFKQSLQRRRCLIPATGFYEWRRLSDVVKIPHAIQLRSGRAFWIAGIHESATEWRPETFLVLTTRPNELMVAIHDRMPVILCEEAAQRWVAPGEMTAAALAEFSVPFPADEMEAFTISRLVNSPKNDGPEVLSPEDVLREQVSPPKLTHEEPPGPVQTELF